jgi:hypothetical protein
MSDDDSIARRYLAAWNLTERRDAVAALYAVDARYTDPLASGTGHDEIAGLIGAVQSQFPGFTFRLAGSVDGHHDLLRFHWELGPDGQEAPIVGFDTVVLDTEGRIQSVLGLLDEVPAAVG